MSEQTSQSARAGMSIPLRRVVITGTGAISPAGVGVDALWSHLMAGETALSALSEEEQDQFNVGAIGRIPNYDPLEMGFTKKEARRFSKFVQYAIIAADEAMAQAAVNLEDEDLTRFACVFGSGIGGIEIFVHESVVMHEKGPKRVSPLFIPTMISNMAAGDLAIRYGLRGECTNMVTACATGSHCLGEAYRLIRFGYADIALAGGSEEGTAGIALAGFGNLGALSRERDVKHASRPFDVNRSGFVAGEGAGALIVESLEHAQARGAHIIAEITGFGSTGDAYHITAPEPHGEGITRAMRLALEEGGFTPADLGHVNAHGTSTPANDKTEAIALQTLCGEEKPQVPVTSIKGCIGHTLGAAGALEAIITARCVSESVVTPTIGFETPDPECPVAVVTKPLTNYPQKVALSNSLGFGGHNASVAISPYTA